MKKVQFTARSLQRLATAIDTHYHTFSSVPNVQMRDAERLLERLMALSFPHFVPKAARSLRGIRHNVKTLRADLLRILRRADHERTTNAVETANAFLLQLPALASAVRLDAEGLHTSDPASKSLSEVIVAYPGSFAVAAYRFAHALLKLNVPLVPRLITEVAHRKTGIDIHPGATIGRSLRIDHGSGVVIGETAKIGDNVQIYQGVTLGALKVEKNLSQKKRHPTIEDNVVIYANATILGGGTVIGHDSVIGGNVWITESVPAHSNVMYQSGE